MSFGFSLSDFALCVKVAHSVYCALKDGPNECKTFAQEVLHLYGVLQGLRDEIEYICKDNPRTAAPLAHQQPGLSEHGLRCLELLLIDIASVENLPFRVSETRSLGFKEGHLTFIPNRDGSDLCSNFSSLKERFRQARFSRKIPHYREAVAGIISRLTAESVLLVR